MRLKIYAGIKQSFCVIYLIAAICSACASYRIGGMRASQGTQNIEMLKSFIKKLASYQVPVLPDGAGLCGLPPPKGHYLAYYRHDNNTICISNSVYNLDTETLEAVLVHEVVHLIQDCVTPNTFFGLASHEIGPIGSRVSIRPEPMPINAWEKNKWSKVWRGLEYDKLDEIQKEAFALQEHPGRVMNELLPQLCKDRGVSKSNPTPKEGYSIKSDFYVPWKVQCVNGGFEAYQVSGAIESEISADDPRYSQYAPFRTHPLIKVAEFILIVDGVEYPAKGYKYSFLPHNFVKGGGYEVYGGQGGISFYRTGNDMSTSDPLLSRSADKETICTNSKYGRETDGFISYNRF